MISWQIQTCFALCAAPSPKMLVWYTVEFHIKFVVMAVPKNCSKIIGVARCAEGRLRKSPKISLPKKGFLFWHTYFSVSFKKTFNIDLCIHNEFNSFLKYSSESLNFHDFTRYFFFVQVGKFRLKVSSQKIWNYCALICDN